MPSAVRANAGRNCAGSGPACAIADGARRWRAAAAAAANTLTKIQINARRHANCRDGYTGTSYRHFSATATHSHTDIANCYADDTWFSIR